MAARAPSRSPTHLCTEDELTSGSCHVRKKMSTLLGGPCHSGAPRLCLPCLPCRDATACASYFLSFSSTAPLSPSLYFQHILLLISIHDHTTSNYFHALFGYSSHLRYNQTISPLRLYILLLVYTLHQIDNMSIPISPKRIHTSSGIPSISVISPFVIRDNVSLTSFLLIIVLNHHLALHPQSQICDSLLSAAYQNIPSIFP